jgi:adenylate cyclase
MTSSQRITLLGHETYSLVKDVVATEERSPIKVKGFSESIRCYKVVGLYDNLVREGQVIREEQEGFKFMLDLEKRDKQEAITTLEADGCVLRQLRKRTRIVNS